MEASKDQLYLYKCNRYYTVGYIKRVNDKTVTMDSGHKFLKTELNDKLYKLSDTEKQLYEGAIVRDIINSRYDISRFLYQLEGLQKALQISALATVDTKQLQSKIDELTEEISKACEQCVSLNNEMYKMTPHHNLEKIS